MITNTIGQLTELQANGGGYFTESYPTNFHHFYKRKVLVGTETAAMFKDVTEAEKTTIEAQDAKWTEPSASLIDRAKAAGAEYNKATGFFKYSLLTDITADEMEIMLAHINEIFLPGGARLNETKARTNIVTASTFGYGWGIGFVNLDGVCTSNNYIEVLNVTNIPVAKASHLQCFAFACNKLHTITGEIDLNDLTQPLIDAFTRSAKLQEVRLRRTKISLNFKDCPLLSLASLQYLVTNAANTSAITITVHKDVYDKLNDASNAEWNAVLTSAEAKQITFATTN